MKPMLKIEGVGMTFATKRGPFVALRDIDLEVARGEFVALIGHSGCGKSTLLNLVAGLTTPTAASCCSTTASSRARPRPWRGVPEPLAAALAELHGQRAPGGRAGLR
jgi:nitrate/nitrite transport system ATP-binding protein